MRIKNKSKKIFVYTLLASLLFVFQYGFGSEMNYKLWDSKKDVGINKIWTITFNKEIDKNTLNNIKIVEQDTNKNVDLRFNYDDKNKALKVSAVNGYKYGKSYTMIINSGLQCLDGKTIVQPVEFEFITENKREEFAKEPSGIINNYDEFYYAIGHALHNFESEIVIQINKYNSQDYKLDVINKVIEDYPNIEYGYNGAEASIISYKDGTAKMTINIKYEFSKEYMMEMRRLSEEKAEEIISKVIKAGMSDCEKELALHDYVVNNSKYDKRLFTGNMPSESYTDYGILVQDTGVCAGYARALYRLLNMADIECIYVTGYGDDGTGTIAHAWNIVKIEGEYYHLDATWDDPVTYTGRNVITHNYFNVNDEKMSRDHVWNLEKYPKCTSTKYIN
ncbi:transglutaminase domain-containing protein [Clostridium sp. ZS2-4]|uniref:transglutaminase domain-containing protein n=1 Tax=Clostridium sp. ZS2-4 TaxID=2987703 RepID=UPI00227BCB00|nr:transglutaminase domain-containing protein [Clostridium sp. ZS2-4]MCY6355961.1 Ig-like domain-containing protein [Clostridium sp. ZS2-4]